MSGADEHAFFKHIEHSVCVNMGLSGSNKDIMRDFARKLAAIATLEAST